MAAGDDTFEQPQRRRLPRIVLAATAALVVAGAIGLVARPDADLPGDLAIDEDEPPPPDETEPEPSPEAPATPEGDPDDDVDDGPDAGADLLEAAGSWSGPSEAPLSPRLAMPVWTGREIIVWGGQRESAFARPFFDDGAAYDPDADQWRELAPAPLSPRGRHVAVWGDGELLIWGGEGRHRLHDDGAAYDPGNDSWSAIPPGPLSPRRDAVAAWVGGELIVAGGHDNAGTLADAAAYDPDAGQWRVVTDELPPGFAAPQARATVHDDRLVVWTTGGGPTGSPGVWRYDPGADAWDEIEAPAPEPQAGPNQWLTATDDALVAVRGQGPGGRPSLAIRADPGWEDVDAPAGSRGGPTDFVNPFGRVVAAAGDRVYVIDDAEEPLRYDVGRDEWAALPAIEPLADGDTRTVPQYYVAVPVGDGVVVWVGGVAEADAMGEERPPGIVIWQAED